MATLSLKQSVTERGNPTLHGKALVQESSLIALAHSPEDMSTVVLWKQQQEMSLPCWLALQIASG